MRKHNNDFSNMGNVIAGQLIENLSTIRAAKNAMNSDIFFATKNSEAPPSWKKYNNTAFTSTE